MLIRPHDFVRNFLPPTVKTFTFFRIDMDVTDLSICDVLRNIDKMCPPNSRMRNDMCSGHHAVMVLCTSTLLAPMDGLLIIVMDDDSALEIVSKGYIVLGIPEQRIRNSEDLAILLEEVIDYFIREFRDIADFNSFFVKYIYDPVLDEDEDDFEYFNLLQYLDQG